VKHLMGLSHCVLILLGVSAIPLLAQWEKVTGSHGGHTQCVAIIDTDLFAGTAAGVFRSTDTGKSWVLSNQGLTASASFLVSGGANLFAGTNGAGVFRSTDNGVHWIAVNNGLTELSISCIAAGDSVVCIGTEGSGIFRSTDQGATWNSASTGLPDAYVRALAVKDSALFAGTFQTGVYRSTDKGASWAPVNNGFRPGSSRFPDSPVQCLVVTDSSIVGAAQYGLYRSTDNGASWTAASALPPSLGKSVASLAANGATILACNDFDMFCSTDNGGSWTTVGGDLPRTAYNTIAVHSLATKDSVFFAGTDAGVFTSIDSGTSWSLVSEGLDASPVSSIVVEGSDLFAIGRNGYGVIHSTDTGSSWTCAMDTLRYHFTHLAMHKPYVLAQTNGPTMVSFASPLLRSTDIGSTWTLIGNIAWHALAVNDRYVFCGLPYGEKAVVRCPVDSGIWTEACEGMPSRASVSVLLAQGSDILAGTEYNGVFYSSDNGDHWVALDSAQAFAYEHLDIVALSRNASAVFAGATDSWNPTPFKRNGVFRTTNNGAIWTAVNNGLTDTDISALVSHGSSIFAGTDSGGVFVSTDNANHWKPCNDGLSNPHVSSLAVNDSFIYAGMLGGLWRRKLSDAVSSVPDRSAEMPAQFCLEQNYPNPFNPVTNIGYSVWGSGARNIRLSVFDLLGREVAVLVNEKKEPKTYEVRFDGSRLASGVYFYRLQAGDFVQTRRLLLLK
jgi:hypothetical protein